MNEEQKAAALEQLRRETANLPKREDLAKAEIRDGANPRYVAFKYGLDVERCVNYAAALEKQQERKRERKQSASGDSPLPEIGEVVNEPRSPE